MRISTHLSLPQIPLFSKSHSYQYHTSTIPVFYSFAFCVFSIYKISVSTSCQSLVIPCHYIKHVSSSSLYQASYIAFTISGIITQLHCIEHLSMPSLHQPFYSNFIISGILFQHHIRYLIPTSLYQKSLSHFIP